jgi:hypothetical protein
MRLLIRVYRSRFKYMWSSLVVPEICEDGGVGTSPAAPRIYNHSICIAIHPGRTKYG